MFTMAETTKLYIPVFPHVKKFIEKTTFLKGTRTLTMNDNIGCFIVKFLEPAPKRFKPITDKTEYMLGRANDKKLAQILSVNMPAWYMRNMPSYMSGHSIYLFNKWADDIMYRQMFTYIEARTAEKRTNVKYLINDFLDQYNINEDELSVISLMRWYYREKKLLKQVDLSM